MVGINKYKYMVIYKYGIELFSTWDDAHSKWISKYFTNYKISYLSFNIRKKFKFGFATEEYMGNHNTIFVGFIFINYGT